MGKRILTVVMSICVLFTMVSFSAYAANKTQGAASNLSYDEIVIENTSGKFDYASMKNQKFVNHEKYSPNEGRDVRTYVLGAEYSSTNRLKVSVGFVNYSSNDRMLYDVYHPKVYYYDAKGEKIYIAESNKTVKMKSNFVMLKGEVVEGSTINFDEHEFNHKVKLSNLNNLHIELSWKRSDIKYPKYNYQPSKGNDFYEKKVFLKNYYDPDYARIEVKNIQYTNKGMLVKIHITNDSKQTVRWNGWDEVYLYYGADSNQIAGAKAILFDNSCELTPGKTQDVSFLLTSGQFDPSISLKNIDYVRIRGVLN